MFDKWSDGFLDVGALNKGDGTFADLVIRGLNVVVLG